MTSQPPADRLARLQQLSAKLLEIPYCPWGPTATQAKFLLNFDREALYGGAVGGGKSIALLMAALQFVNVPGYSALLLRRTYADLALPGAIMDVARGWLGGRPGVRWVENEHVFRFRSGARLAFGYLEKANDRYRYQGAAFQFVGFDELTQFRQSDYRYLFSRIRRPTDSDGSTPLANVPLRMRAASNPGGIGHEWVRQRFIVEGPSKGRRFHPAKLEDNPYLDTDEYEHALAELDPVTRKQLREGDWGAKASGDMFDRDKVKILDVPPDPAVCDIVRYWDLAATAQTVTSDDPDWTVGVKLARNRRNGTWVILHIERFRCDPSEVESKVARVAELDGRNVPVVIEQEPGASGKSVVSAYRRHVLPGHEVHADAKRRDKVTAAGPVAARVAAGELYTVRGPWIGDLLDEMDEFPLGAHDDQVDALSGAFHWLVTHGRDEDVIPGGIAEANAWA